VNKQDIIAYAKSVGAYSCGIVTARRYDELLPQLEKRGFVPFVRSDLEHRIDPFLQMKTAKSFIVCLFKYNYGEQQNVAKYAKGGDYHPFVKENFKKICEYIGQDYKYKLFVDTGTICDKHLAYLAGLGYFGMNNLLYADGLGSRFYIGSILTDLELDPDVPIEQTCLKCGRCIDGCVALGWNFEFDVNKCASYLTQKKEELTEIEKQIVEKCGYSLGCDMCSDVCPLNLEDKNYVR